MSELPASTGRGVFYKALSKAQGKIKKAVKDAKNPFFRSSYADLASVTDACREALTENGFCVIQTTRVTEEGKTVLVTTLAHESGYEVTGELLLRPMTQVKDKGWVDSPDPQSIGSAMTYARRYALAAITGVATEDDDAEAATGRGKAGEQAHLHGSTHGDHTASSPQVFGSDRPASTPAPYSKDDEGSLRGRLIDLAAVYAHSKGFTISDAVKEFSSFHSKDRKTGKLMYREDGSPVISFKTDPKELTGKWLLVALNRAKELTKTLMEDNNIIPPDLLPEV